MLRDEGVASPSLGPGLAFRSPLRAGQKCSPHVPSRCHAGTSTVCASIAGPRCAARWSCTCSGRGERLLAAAAVWQPGARQ